MNNNKIKFAFLLLLASISGFAQLGFCPGSKGEPLFTENFGNGTSYGPALPAGVTTYAFVTGPPQDGQYTLYYNAYQYTTWHNAPDHTPDATNGPNGKMLLMNANAVTSGDFYKKLVTGLCVNTTFEFSAWLMNVYNPNTNYCGAGQIPINVRFEIWNATETVLLGSGNTGNIMGSPTPTWQQFALVFTTVSETSVILKMKNNGVGGCGNDLAIDDISFSACGDLTTVSSPSVTGTTYTTCTSPVSLQLDATTASAVPYFYQWQTSTDATTWTDIPGATNATYNTPNLTTATYYRAKAAQDLANLANIFCSTISNVFTISILPRPNAPTNDGDKTICSGDPIPALTVNVPALTGVNWYSAATGGTLLLANNASYTPTAAGIYYAEAYDVNSNCISTTRTPVQLTIVNTPDVTISGTTSICGGNTTPISFSGTPNAVVTYSDGTTNHTITLNGSGTASFNTQVLTANITYTLISVSLGTCSKTKNDTVTVTVNNTATASITGNATVCVGSPATVNFSGTPNATVTYTVGSATQTIVLNGSGTASISIPSVPATAVYTLTQVSVGGVCTQSLSQSITITAVPMPTAAISANPMAICSNQTSTITFTGTANAVVTYKIDSGANQTITLNASGTATLTTATGLTSNPTYTLISVASPTLSSCVTTVNSSVTITVNSLATASISSNAPVCSGSPATVSFAGTPNAVVTYSVNTGPDQNITLNASGSASVTVPSVTSTINYALVKVALGGVCSQSLTQSINVTSVPVPTATITASQTIICANQTSTINFSGTPNAILTYKIDSGANQTIALNASGTASLTTPAGLTTNITYTLISATSPVLSACTTSINNSVTITVNSLPTASIATNAPVCHGSPATVTFTGTPNATVNYTVGSASQSIVLNASGTASVAIPGVTVATVYTLTSVVSAGTNGCTRTLSQSVTVSPTALPTATISATPATICSGQTSTVTFTGTPNAVVTYTAGSGNQTITLGTSGTASIITSSLSANVTYQLVSVTLAGCSQTLSASAPITINPTPNVTYTGDLVYCEGEQIAINLSSGVSGATFNWTVSQNGTSGAIAGSGNQILQNVVLTNSAVTGTVTYIVTPVHNGCSGTPVPINVTVHPLPVPQITDGVICTTSSSPTNQFYVLNTNLSALNHSFQWFFGTSVIPGATAGSYNATQIGTYTVIATSAAGCASAPVSAVVSQMPMGESLLIQHSAPFSDNPKITVTVVGGGGPFSYKLDDGPFQPSNVFYNVAPGEHTITVIDEFCTNLSAAATIIDYPKFFTPNGDGFNESWNISGLDNAMIWIFDRYGKLLKQITTDGSGWDGTYNGQPLPSTDYWFVLDYDENGVSKNFKAHFALKR